MPGFHSEVVNGAFGMARLRLSWNPYVILTAYRYVLLLFVGFAGRTVFLGSYAPRTRISFAEQSRTRLVIPPGRGQGAGNEIEQDW
jgi:hypothetical protein